MTVCGRVLSVCSAALLFASCGGSSGGGATAPPPPPLPPPPPVADASPGGIWEGVDADGVDIIALVTESGRFRFFNEFLDQGFGVLNVSGDSVSASFQLVTQIGAVFEDGTTLANCSLSGTVIERQSMPVTVDCTTTAGLQTRSRVTLGYDPLYERDSSLALVAGTYDDAGLVLNIDADGVVFEQDPGTQCVVNGQINVIDPDFNAYDVQFLFSSCVGQTSMLNGTSFTGMAALDNSGVPEVLVVGVTGNVAGTLAGLFGISERL